MFKTEWKEKAVQSILLGSALTCIIIVVLIFLFLVKEAVPLLFKVPLSDILDTRWIPESFVRARFGIVPLLTGSLLITSLAIIIAVPFGVIGAVYISELASPIEKEILKPFIELLAGIPSVVIGFFGLMILASVIKNFFHLETGMVALTGAVLLALMAIPVIISISDDAIRSVPASYKEASMALGATRMQTIWKVTIPDALPGIVAAIMLGTGRIVGETMAVMMVTGNAAVITANPFESVRTMTATIAAEMGEVAFGSNHYSALFLVGTVLLLLTFGLNLLAQRVLKKYRRV